MFFSDTAITPNPTGRDLALIAEMTGTVVKNVWINSSHCYVVLFKTLAQ